MPNDTTKALIAAARAHAANLGCPAHEQLLVSIKSIAGYMIAQAVAYPAQQVAKQSTDDLSAKQKRILVALLSGPRKGETLAADCGLGDRTTLFSGKGIKALMAAGLVTNDEIDGYKLTDIGEDVATEIADG